MRKKKLTNKQKKLYGILLAAAVILVLALGWGRDLKQVFHSLFPDGVSAEETLDTEALGDTISDLFDKNETTAAAPTNAPESTKSPLELVEEDGIYTTPELVAAYIHTFHKLPSNFITKNEAAKLGWNSKEGNLWDVTDEKSIGGDRFGNYEKLLPEKNGRIWYECDVNYTGGYRGEERIVYSNDGLIYYTDDHYESFTQLY